MKKIFIIIVFLFTSCKPVYLYTYIPKSLGAEIGGLETNRFFNDNDIMQHINIQKLSDSNAYNNEIDNIIKHIKKVNIEDVDGWGFYVHAIVRGKDTLYCDRDYFTWKYKNLLANYHSDLINNSTFNP